jgi:hypothetical protein
MQPQISKAPYQGTTLSLRRQYVGKVLYNCDIILLKYLALILQSGFLKNEPIPLSTVFISKAGIGKSRLIKLLKHEKYVYYVTDITPKFLVNEFLPEIEKGKYKFIGIGDFTNVTDSHSERTGGTIISLLRNITEEGAGKIKDFGMSYEPKKDIHAGLITSTTISSYSQFASSWKKTGFLSRVVPFSFTHSSATSHSILDDIDNNVNIELDKLPFKIKTRAVPFIEPNPELSRQFRYISEDLGKATNSMPYRAQIQLNKLAKANAILRGDNKLTQEDINEVSELATFLNYDFEAI